MDKRAIQNTKQTDATTDELTSARNTVLCFKVGTKRETKKPLLPYKSGTRAVKRNRRTIERQKRSIKLYDRDTTTTKYELTGTTHDSDRRQR